MITVRAAAGPLSRSSGSVTDHQKRRFFCSQSSSDHRNFTWWPEQVSFRAAGSDVRISSSLLRTTVSRISQTASQFKRFFLFFFQFSWLVWHQHPPWKVLPAVKQEVKSFKLLLPPMRPRVMCSETPAVRGNVSVTFFCIIFTWGGTNTAVVATANSGWTTMTSFSLATLLPRFSFEFQWRDRTLISWCLYCPLLLNTWHLTSQWFVSKKKKKRIRDFAEQRTVWELIIILIRFQRHI